MQYNAFLSYSHAADAQLGARLHSALQRFAKPWYRLRAVTVFRDKTSLAVTPGLWPAIEAALRSSEYFILMASPQAAVSPWVTREVEWWCANRSAATLLIVLTDGVLVWAGSDFDWNQSDALPRCLRNAFADEPLYLDLRWAREGEDLSLRNPRFREAVAELAAPLRGVSKTVLVGEDVRQHRRTRRVAWSAGVLLVLLTLAAITGGYVARDQRNRAEQERSEAEGLIQFMLVDLRDRLEPIGRLDLLEEVNRRTRQYYQAFPAERDDAERRYQRAAALSNAAEYLRRRGESAEALRIATASRDLIKQTVDRDPRNVDAQRHLAAATTELARVHQEVGDLILAEELLRSAAAALEPLRRTGGDAALLADLAATQRALGTLLHVRQKPGALESYDEALAHYRHLAARNAAEARWRRDVAAVLTERGALLKDLGRLPEALAAYTESYEIVRALAARDPGDMQRRHAVAIARGALAGVLADQGEIARAQHELSAKREIVQRLTDHDPANALWQVELADTDGALAALHAREGRFESGARVQREAIARLERLVATNPHNPAWSEALASAHDALGEVSFTAGRFEEGIRSYQAGLRVVQALATAHPDHPGVLRAKAIAYAKAAQLYADGLQDRAAALTMYGSVIETFERMTRDNSRNVVAWDDLAVAHERLARTHANAGQFDEAVAAFRSALAIRVELRERDPSNLRWQGDVVRLQQAAGSVSLARGDLAGADELFREALSRLQQLAGAHPDEVSWHSLAALGHERIAAVHLQRGEHGAAIAAYREALASMREVVRLAPGAPETRRNLEVVQQQLAATLAAARDPNDVRQSAQGGQPYRQAP